MTLDIVIFGLSITSSWGNGHATTYRALIKALARRGHRITFLERATPWYRRHCDLERASFCRIETYESLSEIPRRFGLLIARADLVILGSYVPDGAAIGEWLTAKATGVTAFYDIDTPVTLSNLRSGKQDYIAATLIPRFDLFLSFTGGPVLGLIESEFGSPRARVLYCSADTDEHRPVDVRPRWDLGYLGTYSADRQMVLDALLLSAARQSPSACFIISGAQYPDGLEWPSNVEYREHVPPAEHAAFYNAQRFTLNATRSEMVKLGFSPSVRLFEAAACGVPVISDDWPGLGTLFDQGEEILLARNATDLIAMLGMSDDRRRAIAAAARKRFMREHTPDQRAKALEGYYSEVCESDQAEALVSA